MKISWNSELVVACSETPSPGLLPEGLGKSVDSELGLSFSPL